MLRAILASREVRLPDTSGIYAPLSGLLAAGSSVALLRWGWATGRLQTTAGWLTLILALILLSRQFGILVGSTIALLAFSLCGFMAVALNIERRVIRHRRTRIASEEVEQPARREYGWGRGLSATFLAMIAALTMGSAAAGIPLGAAVNRVTLGPMVLSIVWAGFIIWIVSDPKLRRPVIGLAGIIAGSGAVIALELLA